VLILSYSFEGNYHTLVNKKSKNPFVAGQALLPFVWACFPDFAFKAKVNNQIVPMLHAQLVYDCFVNSAQQHEKELKDAIKQDEASGVCLSIAATMLEKVQQITKDFIKKSNIIAPTPQLPPRAPEVVTVLSVLLMLR
jgi:hypothetical protein